MIKRVNAFVLPVMVLLAMASAASAVEITPFGTQNQNPLVQIFGLPRPDSAFILKAGQMKSSLGVDLSSNFGTNDKVGENIVIDGETYRATVDYRFGFNHGVEAGIEVPYVFYTGGFLDDFIQDFHNTFGFDQNGRDAVRQNRLLISYEKNGVQKLNITHANSGIGDVRLHGGVQLYHDGKSLAGAVALRGSVKFPTGDSSELHGSGSTDFALWLSASDNYPLWSGQVTVFGSAGGMVMTKGDVLRDQQRDAVGFGTVGIGWSPLTWLALVAQLNLNTSFYSGSDLVEVNSGSGHAVIGTTFALPRDFRLDLAVVEDLITTASAPDVVFHFALRKQF